MSYLISACHSAAAPELRIDFASAPATALSIAGQPGQETWPWGVEGIFEFSRRQFIRKQQSDFGWDWGPGFAPAGIWQKAWIIQLEPGETTTSNSAFDIYRKGQLNNLPPDQSADWIFNASIDAITPIPKDSVMKYTIVESNGGLIVSSGALTEVHNAGDVISGITTLKGSDYKLWWPVGMGEQTLYNITVDVITKSGSTISSVTKRTGFRTIVLNMGEVTQEEVNQGVTPGNHCMWHYHVP